MAAPDAFKVAVVGAAGYVGGELLRILLGHPSVGELRAYSSSAAGRPWSDVHPSLINLGRSPLFEDFDPAAAGAWADVVFLALPHSRSQELVEVVEAGGPELVIDTAADFRLTDRERFESVYGPHRAPDLLDSFVYGLADVEATNLVGATRIAVPGCFATAALLTLWPLAGLLGPSSHPVCCAATGSSGSGAQVKSTTHHPFRAHNYYAYGLGGHRHEAELDEQLAAWSGEVVSNCTLITHSAPIVRGIHATLRVLVVDPLTDPNRRLRESYDGRPFIHVLDRPPEVAPVVGTNHAHLHAAARNGGHEVIVVCAIDNLVKGAAGQAVQAMNLARGIPETEGLEFVGMAPC